MIFSHFTMLNLSSTFITSWKVEKYSLKISLSSLIWQCFLSFFFNLKRTTAAFVPIGTFVFFTPDNHHRKETSLRLNATELLSK